MAWLLNLETRRDLAALHFAATELSIEGLIPLLTMRNAKGFDIAAINPENGRSVNIQVRAQSKAKWWGAKTTDIPDVVYFLVEFSKNGRISDYFILSQKELERVRQYEKKGVPYFVYKDDIAKFQRHWLTIQSVVK